MRSLRFGHRIHVSPSLILLGVLLTSLWLAGGASRADALGQVAVRLVAWSVLIVACFSGPRPTLGHARPLAILLAAAFAIPVLQLIPLPPGLWQALPGHDSLAEAAIASGQSQPWRPISIVPGATLNAAASLVVPFAVMMIVLMLNTAERRHVPTFLLVFVGASMAMAVLQFSAGSFDNAFVNDSPSVVSGTFANRNHFALLLAISCLLIPVWAVTGERAVLWRMVLAAGLVLLLLLMLLAVGSRAGLGLGLVAILLALLISGRTMRRALKRRSRWAFPALLATIVAAIATLALVSVVANRAESVSRAVATDQTQEVRAAALPTVVHLTKAYFPFGTGLGSFDPAFRMVEPDQLLKPTYFNNAHSDVLEVVLTAGLPGLIVLTMALGWLGLASYRAWWSYDGQPDDLARLGSGILLLVALASLVDYPARTPAIMAVMVIAALWLSGRGDRSPALP